jgi:hypothetical protein
MELEGQLKNVNYVYWIEAEWEYSLFEDPNQILWRY